MTARNNHPLTARGWRTDGIIRPERRRPENPERRYAVRYTDAELADILSQARLGFRRQDIAEWHERSIGGIAMVIERAGDQPR